MKTNFKGTLAKLSKFAVIQLIAIILIGIAVVVQVSNRNQYNNAIESIDPSFSHSLADRYIEGMRTCNYEKYLAVLKDSEIPADAPLITDAKRAEDYNAQCGKIDKSEYISKKIEKQYDNFGEASIIVSYQYRLTPKDTRRFQPTTETVTLSGNSNSFYIMNTSAISFPFID